MKNFNFHLDPSDKINVLNIIARARSMYAKSGIMLDCMSLEMDLAACHNHAQKLDFGRLREFPDFDFAHDISGIINCLDRTTGELRNCFLPRCSVREMA